MIWVLTWVSLLCTSLENRDLIIDSKGGYHYGASVLDCSKWDKYPVNIDHFIVYSSSSDLIEKYESLTDYEKKHSRITSGSELVVKPAVVPKPYLEQKYP